MDYVPYNYWKSSTRYTLHVLTRSAIWKKISHYLSCAINLSHMRESTLNFSFYNGLWTIDFDKQPHSQCLGGPHLSLFENDTCKWYDEVLVFWKYPLLKIFKMSTESCRVLLKWLKTLTFFCELLRDVIIPLLFQWLQKGLKRNRRGWWYKNGNKFVELFMLRAWVNIFNFLSLFKGKHPFLY